MCYHRCILLTVESTLILLIYYFCSLVPQPLALKGLRHYRPTFTWLSKVMLMSSSFLMYFQVSSHTEICCEQFYVGTIFLGPTWNCTQYDLWIILSNQVMIFGKRHCCWVFQMYFFCASSNTSQSDTHADMRTINMSRYHLEFNSENVNI